MLRGRHLAILLAGVGALLALTAWALVAVNSHADDGATWWFKPEMELADDGQDEQARAHRIARLTTPAPFTYADLQVSLDGVPLQRAAGPPDDGEWAAFRGTRLLLPQDTVHANDTLVHKPSTGDLEIVLVPCNCHLLAPPRTSG